MKKLLIILTLLCTVPGFAQAQVTRKHPAISEEKGTFQIIRQTENTLQEHQKALELEIKATEKKLARLASKNQKSAQAQREKLKNRLKTLKATLKSMQRDKKTVASTRDEYQKKFGPLATMQAREKEFKKQPLAAQRDILAIELSEPSKNAIMAEISNKKNEKRLMQIVAILIDHTGTMDAPEKEYWRNLPPDIPFEHRFRLLEILATERQKLAALERTHRSDLQRLNKQHAAEWEKVCPKGAGDKKYSPLKSGGIMRR